MTEFASWAALVLSVINTMVILHTRAWVARWTDNLRRLL